MEDEELLYDEFNILKKKGLVDNYNINILDFKVSEKNESEKIETDLSYISKKNVYNLKITVDKDLGYCYIESKEGLNLNSVNMKLSLYRKREMNIDVIFKTLVDFLSNSENEIDNKLEDKLNIFNEKIMESKCKINYRKLENSGCLYNVSVLESNIPNELLFTKDQIFKMVINEIKKINNNFDYDHYVIPINNNPYELYLNFKFKNGKLGEKLKKINKKFNYDYIQFKIFINHKLYPFYPYKLEYCKPKIDMQLLFSFMNIELLETKNWNPTVSLEWFINKLSEKLEKFMDSHIDVDSVYNKESIAFSKLEYNLIELSSITKFNPYEKIKLDFNVNKLDFNSKDDSNGKYWSSGVGYGYTGNNKWDINKYIKNKEENNIKIEMCLEKIINIIDSEEYNEKILLDSTLSKYLLEKVKETNILEIDKSLGLYKYIFELLNIFSKLKTLPREFVNSINKYLCDLGNEISSFLNELDLVENIPDENKNLYKMINNVCSWYDSNSDNLKMVSTKIPTNDKEKYLNMIKENQFGNFEFSSSHKYFKNKNRQYSAKSKMSILRQIGILKKSLPICWDTSIMFRISKKYFNMVTIIIVGPKDTPYHNGLFEFHATFPETFPKDPPEVLIETNGNGNVRFNPNLYEGRGKVCLSLLGTWRGEAGEEWNEKNSTLLQVLISIQSLILVDEPYYNEPGWEKQMHTSEGKRKSFDYKDNIRLQTIKWAINNQIKNPPQSYENIVKNHFIAKKKELIETTNEWIKDSKKVKKEMNEERKKMIDLLEKLENGYDFSKDNDDKKTSQEIGPLKKKIKLDLLLKKENNNLDNKKEDSKELNL